jgi:hypothetical protein
VTVLRLLPNGPADFGIALRMLAAHAIPGAEEADVSAGSYVRLLAPAGSRVRVEMAFTESAVVVTLPDGLPDPAGIAATVRRFLDLDSDTALIAGLLALDPVLRRW